MLNAQFGMVAKMPFNREATLRELRYHSLDTQLLKV
jgi:hypothetical protein